MKKITLILLALCLWIPTSRAQLLIETEVHQTSPYPNILHPHPVVPVPSGADISPYVRDGLITIKGYSNRNYMMYLSAETWTYIFGYDLKLTDGNRVTGLFSGGAATAYRDGKPVVLTADGTLITPPDSYAKITDFKDGIAVVEKVDAKTYTTTIVYINNKMEETYPNMTQTNVGYVGSNDLKPTGILSENMRAFYDLKSKKWGYMDGEGKQIIAPQFLEALPFREGRAAVLIETQQWGPRYWGFIDAQGTFKVEPIYKVKPTSFSGGYAAVNTGDYDGTPMILIDLNGDIASRETKWLNSPYGDFCLYDDEDFIHEVKVFFAGKPISTENAVVAKGEAYFTPPNVDINGERGIIFYNGCAAVGKYDGTWRTSMGAIITNEGASTIFTPKQTLKYDDENQTIVEGYEIRNCFYGFFDQPVALFTYGFGKKQNIDEMGWVRGFVNKENDVVVHFKDIEDNFDSEMPKTAESIKIIP